MVFLELAEWLVAILIVLTFVTQIFIPLWKGEKLFPLFRERLACLEEEIAEVKEDVVVGQTKRKLKKLKKTVEDLERDDADD